MDILKTLKHIKKTDFRPDCVPLTNEQYHNYSDTYLYIRYFFEKI